MSPGELYVVDFGSPTRGVEQANVRPAMVVHSPTYNRIPHLAVFCPITKANRGVPNHVAVPPGDETGLRQPSFVMTEQLRAVDRRYVGARIGMAPREATTAVLRIVRDRILARPG